MTSTPGDRSLSRGRDVFVRVPLAPSCLTSHSSQQSSGRGGAGNIRRASASRDARPDGPDDFSTTRGREPRLAHPSEVDKIISTGRGGAGNIRSPSRDARSNAASDAAEEQIIISHVAAEQNAAVRAISSSLIIIPNHTMQHSTGRGGIGNIRGGSRSRSRARDGSIPPGSGAHTPLHSSGRGGAGNIFSGHTPSVAEADEKDAASHIHLSPRPSSDMYVRSLSFSSCSRVVTQQTLDWKRRCCEYSPRSCSTCRAYSSHAPPRQLRIHWKGRCREYRAHLGPRDCTTNLLLTSTTTTVLCVNVNQSIWST